jgi:transcriptional regulator with XRE-family HTH domain
MENHQRAIGARLLALRKANALSQEDAAHKVGVSTSAWGDWERGKHAPIDANWRRIEQAFGIDAAQIRGTPPPPLFPVGSEAPAPDELRRIRQELAEIRQALGRLEAKMGGGFGRSPGAGHESAERNREASRR